MTDSEKEGKINLRLAYEEANRWLRHFDSFLWAVSSALLVATGLIIKLVIYWDGKDWIKFTIELIIILLWYFYFCVIRTALVKEQEFVRKANKIKKSLNIDVLLDDSDIIDTLDGTIHSKRTIKMFNKIKSVEFVVVMVYCFILVCIAFTILNLLPLWINTE